MVYTYDIIIFESGLTCIEGVKVHLKEKFQIKNLK